MIIEALRWYVESLSAFWVSLSGGGLFKMILIFCLIYCLALYLTTYLVYFLALNIVLSF